MEKRRREREGEGHRRNTGGEKRSRVSQGGMQTLSATTTTAIHLAPMGMTPLDPTPTGI